eukprot:tig00020610_g12075.t1
MAAPAEKASANVPSRVVHWRSIGPDVTQAELTALCAPFGAVQQVLLLRTKGQALVQMADLNSAVNLITYYSNVPASIRGRVVYAQYSSHQELTGESRNPSSAPSDEQGGPRGQQQEAPPNRILLVTISNPLYPITVDVLNQVFSPYGSIEKIVIFQKSAGLQALVQYSVLQSAVEAKNRLQGQNIYAGSCTLHIQFSNLQQLTVHHNTDKTRDFTNPNLPTEAPPRQQGGGGGQGSQGQNANAAAAAAAAAAAGVAGNTGLFNPVSASPQHVQQLTQLAASGVINPQLMQQLLTAQTFSTASMGPPGANIAPQLMTSPLFGTDRSTLLVSNLNAEKTDCDALFNLFSNYGNIVRIKILHNKRDHALIQMGDNLQSTFALTYLKNVTMFGHQIDVNYSKYSYIQSGPDASGQDTNTRDYTHSPLNRFVKNAQKNYKHICAPGPMLHLSNLAPSITKESIMEAFAPFGNCANLKFFETNNRRQCLLQYYETSPAVDALCSMHNKPVDGQNIRVAFSKNTI